VQQRWPVRRFKSLMAIIVATSDVSQSITDELRQDCGPDLKVRSRTSVALMSTDPPSFIRLVAESSEWSLALKLAASTFLAPFLAQLGKDAGDDLRKNKAAIAKALANASVTPIRTLKLAGIPSINEPPTDPDSDFQIRGSLALVSSGFPFREKGTLEKIAAFLNAPRA
jgi:hypothetical protein